ncbi:ATP-dependent Clp protease proteolytic subunit [Sagittula sp.]|uniref:Clp protease ClpP n=1 Tax=Sagittula sp. TaxID=2038081 RepID=UPI0035161D74
MADDIKTQGLKGTFSFAFLDTSDDTVIRAKIEGPIGFRFEEEDGSWVGETAASFLNAVNERVAANANAEWLEVDLNSPGGLFNEAVAIKTGLTSLDVKVRYRTTSISASAAAYLAVTGDEHVIAEDASMMMHEASGGGFGTAKSLEARAEGVRQIDGIMVKRFARKSEKSEDEIRALIDGKDYWMTGLDAVAMGFADALIDPQNVTACADIEELQALNAPEDVIAKAQAAADETGETGETQTDPEVTIDPAPAEVTDPETETNPETGADDDALSEEAQAEIVTACRLFGKEDQAAAFITAKASLDDVRDALFEARAQEDKKTEIDNRIPTAGAPDESAVAAHYRAGKSAIQALNAQTIK